MDETAGCHPMSGNGIYLTWLADVLRAAGLTVVEVEGWQTRARSSGGFPSTPLGVQWHHTASQTSPENDIQWQVYGCDDAPVGNMTLMRDASIWLIAAGAANTAGKGGPLTLSRGTIPLDSANTRTVAMEVANSGVGEPWSEVQVNAYFAASNAINARLGNLPTDVFSHALGAGDGWTDRKIDPATADAVQGPWKPRSVNSSGTWSLADIRAECAARAGLPVPPTPVPVPPEPTPVPPDPSSGDDFMASLPNIQKGDTGPYVVRMQHLLAAGGFMNPGNTANYDGVWGNGTDGAKSNFDHAHGLGGSDTSCGPKSWESLMTGRVW